MQPNGFSDSETHENAIKSQFKRGILKIGMGDIRDSGGSWVHA